MSSRTCWAATSRIADRIIFEKLIQFLRFGCSYASIADCTCSATTIRDRRDEWIKARIFGELKADRAGVL
jgi:transposase